MHQIIEEVFTLNHYLHFLNRKQKERGEVRLTLTLSTEKENQNFHFSLNYSLCHYSIYRILKYLKAPINVISSYT